MKNLKSLKKGDEVLVPKELLEENNVKAKSEDDGPDVKGVVTAIADTVLTVRVALSDGRLTTLEIAIISDKLAIVGQKLVEQTGFFKRLWKGIVNIFK